MKKVLIIGAGRIAGINESDPYREKPCTHAGAYLQHPEFELLGVVDIETEKAEMFAQRFGLRHYFANISEAIERICPDLVSVAVPFRYHCDVINEVASHKNRPWAIFCEKPIADSLTRAEEMVALCRKWGVRLFVNNRRLTSIYQELQRVVQREFDNEIITINAWCSSGLHAIGIHMIELLRMVCGEVVWVQAEAETEYVESLTYSTNFEPNDPRVKALIGFENGVVGSFVNSALTRFTYFDVEVLCRGGKVRVSDNGRLLQVWKPMPPEESTLSYRLEEPVNLNIPSSRPLFANIAESLARADRDDQVHPLSGYHGLQSYRVLDALVSSAQNVQRVEII